MRIIIYISILSLAFLICECAVAQDMFADYDMLLGDYVKGGKVDYEHLSQDSRLDDFIKKISEINPEQFQTEEEKLAFYINLYNAYTLKVVCDNYPLSSINDLNEGPLVSAALFQTTIWDKELVVLNGKKTTLNTVEHVIIRGQFKEPRVHFALVAAAKSSPPLREEAYRAEKLDSQLNEQGRIFLSDTNKNSFDKRAKVAYISSVFNWFKKDFGNDKEERLAYLSQFVSEDISKRINKKLKLWSIIYKRFDWTLNE